MDAEDGEGIHLFESFEKAMDVDVCVGYKYIKVPRGEFYLKDISDITV